MVESDFDRKMTSTFVFALILVFLLTSIPSITFEVHLLQGHDPRAHRLVEQGNELLEKNQYEAALGKFTTALPLYQKPGDRNSG